MQVEVGSSRLVYLKVTKNIQVIICIELNRTQIIQGIIKMSTSWSDFSLHIICELFKLAMEMYNYIKCLVDLRT